jgi:hypothetical protein
MTPTAVLLLKAPVPGSVKTRLARDVGPNGAAEIYQRLVRHQLGQIPDDWPVTVHFTPAHATDAMRTFLGDRPTYVAQPDGDLGVRLQHATAQHFAQPSAGPLLLIGGDCPYLRKDVLTAAAATLGQREVCIIPALDGGYVLIGLAANHPTVFADIAWSTPRVYLQTTRQCLAAGLTLRLIEPALEDIDHLPAWQRALASGTMQTPPATESTSPPPPSPSAATAVR